MNRHYYSDSLAVFLGKEDDVILGLLARNSEFPVEPTQRDAWLEEIRILKLMLAACRGQGKLYFEYAIPRLGRRIDVVAIIEHVIFVLEFKVGERTFPAHAVDQVWDYALDLKNAYRVLLTRARQGMVIVVPEGDPADPTRKAELYDSTYDYLRRIGLRAM
jgi:Uncharacterized conserved protein (DUF2075)